MVTNDVTCKCNIKRFRSSVKWWKGEVNGFERFGFRTNEEGVLMGVLRRNEWETKDLWCPNGGYQVGE